MKTRILTLALLLLAASVASAITPAQARSTAIAFLHIVKPNFDPAEISRMYVNTHPDVKTFWFVTFPHYGVDIDDVTGAVIGYEDTALYGRAMAGPESRGVAWSGHPFYASAATLVDRARNVLASVGWAHGSALRHHPFPNPDGAGNIPRALITINFDDAPSGYPTYGNGNTSLVTLDSLTGEVIEMERHIGFRYGPARVNITPEQAIAAAARVVALGGSPRVIGPAYQDLSLFLRDDALSSAGRSLANTKTCPLVYVVQGITEDVLISSDTAEVFDHYSNATSSGTRPSKSGIKRKPGSPAMTLGTRQQAVPPPSPWPIIILIATPIVAVGVAGAMLLSRRGAK